MGKSSVACTRTRILGHLTHLQWRVQTLDALDRSKGNPEKKSLLNGRLGELIKKIGGLSVQFRAGHMQLGAIGGN